MHKVHLITLGLFIALTQSGCKMVSETMFACGHFLDPDNVRCVDHVGNCSLCGEDGVPDHFSDVSGDAGAVIPAQYLCPECGNPGAAAPMPYDLVEKVTQIQNSSDEFRKELDGVNNELVQRGQALVQTRAELARVQSDVVQLRDNVTHWQGSMKQLHQQIRRRDAERLAMLNELSSGLRNVLQDATTTR
jgi:hypothetical protein